MHLHFTAKAAAAAAAAEAQKLKKQAVWVRMHLQGRRGTLQDFDVNQH